MFKQAYIAIRELIMLLAVGSVPVVIFGQDHVSMADKRDIIDENTVAAPFAPGVVSSKFDEWATSFSPDEKTVYFSRGVTSSAVCFSTKRNGVWQRPQVASFSGIWNDFDAFVSPDGSKLFFSSNRPLEGVPQDKPNAKSHLWYVERTQDGQWGTPHHVDSGVNISSSNDYGPSVSAKGTLYWCSRNREGHKGMQSFYAVWLEDHYDQPKMVNVPGVEEVQDPFIATDERYLVFLSGNDLYISFRQGDGWSPAENLGSRVNTGSGNSSPYVSHDGKMLYYTSNRTEGFYKRDKNHAMSYEELEKEYENMFNGRGNILMIPIHLPAGL